MTRVYTKVKQLEDTFTYRTFFNLMTLSIKEFFTVLFPHSSDSPCKNAPPRQCQSGTPTITDVALMTAYAS